MQENSATSFRAGRVAGLTVSALLAVAAAGCTSYDPVADEVSAKAHELAIAGHEYDQNSVIVKFRDSGISTAAVSDALAEVGASFEDKNRDGRDDRFASLGNGRLAKLDLHTGMRVEEALVRLQNHPGVEYAEPNYIVHADLTPNDPDFGQLYGMAKISAPDAWDTTVGSQDVVVGIIDTGISYGHEDLAANVFVNPGEIAGNGVDDDGNGFIDDVHGINAITGTGDPDDDNDHGSHVAGTIGGVGDNGIGVVGVNWQVSLMGLKFLSASGSGSTADAITCIDYAVDMRNRGVNLRVLSNSWGGGGFSQALEDAISAANDAGILFVAAAGNSATDNDVSPHFPSSYEVDNVLAVASTDSGDNLSSFSCFGTTSVDLGAPGSSILSTIPGNSYATFSGTSMATPHVSGAAALVLSINDTLSVTELKTLLMDSGDPIAALNGITVSGNRLNVARAIEQADPQPGYKLEVDPGSQTINQGDSTSYAITTTSVLGFSETVDLSVSASPALNATVSISPSTVGADGAATLSVATSTATATGDYNLTVTGTSTGTGLVKSRTVALTVRPEGTVEQSYTNSTPVSIPDNDATGITSTIDVPDSLTISGAQVAVDITHTFIGDLIVELTSPAGTTVRLHDRSGGSADDLVQTYDVADFNGENSAGTWTLFVSDNAGIDLGTLNTWTLTIIGAGDGPPPPNQAPSADFDFSASDLNVAFTDLSSDSDGTIVSHSWDFGDGNGSSAQDPTHTYAAAGTYTVTLTVTDDDGATDSVSQDVTVTDAPPPPTIDLSVSTASKSRRNRVRVDLSWTGATGANVEVFRDGASLGVTANDGAHRDRFTSTANTFVYQVCETDGSACSNEVTVQF
ncbi:S8 family serine peptidase [Haliangium sp.]|uniref:S8 family serine peptidase n=1 Tax=Haliangium sp. TaxID=2663208 RepID=UPI003D13AE4D